MAYNFDTNVLRPDKKKMKLVVSQRMENLGDLRGDYEYCSTWFFKPNECFLSHLRKHFDIPKYEHNKGSDEVGLFDPYYADIEYTIYSNGSDDINDPEVFRDVMRNGKDIYYDDYKKLHDYKETISFEYAYAYMDDDLLWVENEERKVIDVTGEDKEELLEYMHKLIDKYIEKNGHQLGYDD